MSDSECQQQNAITDADSICRSFDDVATYVTKETLETKDADDDGLDSRGTSGLGYDELRWLSITGGLLGLGAVFLVWMVLTSLLRGLVDMQGIQSRFVRSAVFQCVYFPALAFPTTLITVVVFCFRSVFGRFCIIGLLLSPGLFAVVSICKATNVPINPTTFPALVFTTILSASLAGISIQLWSPWCLTPHHIHREHKSDWGTRFLMELTTFIAVIYFVWRWVSPNGLEFSAEFVVVNFIVCGISVISGLATINVLHVNRANKKLFLVNCGMVWAMVVPLNSHWIDGVPFLSTSGSTALLSMVGALAIILPTIGSLYWLRLCGWRCFKRAQGDTGYD